MNTNDAWNVFYIVEILASLAVMGDMDVYLGYVTI